MATTYHCRPSDLLALDDPYARYCVDEAVYAWAVHVESSVNRAGSHIKDIKQRIEYQSRYLLDLLNEEEGTADQPIATPAPRKYADPANLVKRGKN